MKFLPLRDDICSLCIELKIDCELRKKQTNVTVDIRENNTAPAADFEPILPGTE